MGEKKNTLEEVSASIKHYYDSLTDDEVAENLAWGEFASAQFDREECSGEWRGGTACIRGEESSEIGRLVIARQLLKY